MDNYELVLIILIDQYFIMAKFTTITRKKEDNGEKTVNATEFINRMFDSQRVPENNVELPKTELPK